MTATRFHALLHRPWVVWLAVWVGSLSALVPTVSHAVAHGHRASWIEICTSSGPRTVAVEVPARQEPAQFLDHCPFCLQGLERAAPPPQPALFFFPDSGRKLPRLTGLDLGHCGTSTVVPPPRGPPLFV